MQVPNAPVTARKKRKAMLSHVMKSNLMTEIRPTLLKFHLGMWLKVSIDFTVKPIRRRILLRSLPGAWPLRRLASQVGHG
jgi:hypothetical protein